MLDITSKHCLEPISTKSGTVLHDLRPAGPLAQVGFLSLGTGGSRMRMPLRTALTAASLIVSIVGLTGCSGNQSWNFLSFGQKAEQKKQLNREVLVYSLEELDHRVADHSSPDAMMY